MLSIGRARPSQDSNADWWCDSKSPAWVARLESLICVLDCEECGSEGFQNMPEFMLTSGMFLNLNL